MSKRLNITGVLSTVQILLFTLRKGRLVGVDEFGNRYYSGKPRRGSRRERRWVIYAGSAEASKIPAEWHGWMHHQCADPPPEGHNPFRKPWQVSHKPNMTGTEGAYLPPGHTLMGGKRPKATADYEAWTPEKT